MEFGLALFFQGHVAPSLRPDCGWPLPRWPRLPRRWEDCRHLWRQHSRTCFSATGSHRIRDQICKYVLNIQTYRHLFDFQLLSTLTVCFFSPRKHNKSWAIGWLEILFECECVSEWGVQVVPWPPLTLIDGAKLPLTHPNYLFTDQ